ncbi:hypothetical protein GCM10009534_01230 [Kribbella sandramycini]
MQPWTDHTSPQPALAALLADVLPANRRTLVLGPHSSLQLESVLVHSSDVTVLVRSVSDAESLAESFGPNLQVIAGALDGLQAAPFEVIVATDGLDRVLGYDSAELTWSERLAAVHALATPDAVVVLALQNEFSVLNLLDRRPDHLRHGDTDWTPLHDDDTRPVSVDQFTAALPWPATVYADYAAHTLIDTTVAATARPGHLPTRLAIEALEASPTPLLAAPTESVESASRAGLLAAIPTTWLAICNTPTPQAIYTPTLKATSTTHGWQITSAPIDPTPSGVYFDPTVVPVTIPDGVTVETTLLRLAAAEDVPAFRKLAAQLGEWATSSNLLLRWDDVVLTGDTFTHGVSGWVNPEPVDKADLLAAAWLRFHHRLIDNHRRHPWPPWMVGDDLVSAWLAMSGIDPVPATPATAPHAESIAADQLARAKELTAALSAALETQDHSDPDLRTALADAARARHDLHELQGHVFGLERTLNFRNKALKTRENRIRELRAQVQKATADRTKLHGSRTYALARQVARVAQLRKPRKLKKALRKYTNKLRPRR